VQHVAGDGTSLAERPSVSGNLEMTEDTMNRTAPTTDLLTKLGVMASIAGILLCLLFLFTPVTFGAMGTNAVIEHSPDLQISMRWIQPILGRAIVEDALIRQRSNEAATQAALVDEPSKPEAGSVQWVMGRVIVELNRSRMIGGLSAGSRHDDQRIVIIARHAVEQLREGVVDSRMSERLTANVNLMF
jgi:hypothetical protein